MLVMLAIIDIGYVIERFNRRKCTLLLVAGSERRTGCPKAVSNHLLVLVRGSQRNDIDSNSISRSADISIPRRRIVFPREDHAVSRVRRRRNESITRDGWRMWMETRLRAFASAPRRKMNPRTF